MDEVFFSAQGFNVTDNIVFQDTQSTMKLANNGRASSGKHTRHIKIHYLFVTDNIFSNKVWVNYCPTELLIADFYTKPLEGTLFEQFRDLILNVEENQCESLGYFNHVQDQLTP